LELPLDHFRLIGVSPSASSEEILRAFQLRLDKTPDNGFTYEVLAQRSELLRLTADLLTNSENRKKYEDQVLKGASGLEVPSNREVAGLILLWESGSPKEAFKLARKALQPPQTPALGSGRESDLTLLAALTAKDAAIKEQDQRCYANASDFLQEGIQILQRMGKMGELRKVLEDDLSALLPYRILDYLSRDLSDEETHKKGVDMLFNFVSKRGGLEGSKKLETEDTLDQNNFEAFFQQVKSFLTVREQIELFLNLQRKGSTEAGYLAFIALTAEGFAKQKPEKLLEAQKLIKNIKLSEMDLMPLIGCLDLLLANVEKAEERFLISSDENLKDWLLSYQGENLDAICLYCKNWLENEVLKGYRDIKIDQVNLDLWFDNKVIQEFIEKQERKSTKALSGAYMQKISNNLKKIIDDSNNDMNSNNTIDDESNLPLPGGNKKNLENYSDNLSQREFIKIKFVEIFNQAYEKYAELRFIIGDLLKNNGLSNKSNYLIYTYVFIVLFIFGIGLSYFRSNNKNNLTESNNTKIIDITKQEIESSMGEELNNVDKNSQNNSDRGQLLISSNELKVQSPNLNQIRILIESWYFNKSRFLAGKGDPDLSNIVKRKLIDRLYEERKSDIKNNIFKNIATEIQNIEFVSQSSSRISVLVDLIYDEEIVSVDGKVISKTTYPLKVKYIFGFSNKSWKLVDYVSGR
tara:strand:- start:1388 stop:3466 length:2079 start_codon:yes stop_codon:yes gene_type:complete